jgi:hypothetical protein
MSYTTSLIAAHVPLADLRSAVFEIWPHLLVVEEASVAGLTELSTWSASHGGAELEASAFYQDGDWAVLFDPSLTMAADDGELRALSARAGRVIVATTQGTAGFAEVAVFDHGDEIRRITSSEGELTETGTPLPEETGLDLSDFYMDANEELVRRLGLRSFWGEIEGPITGVLVRDTRFPADVAATPPPRRKRKPWWQFW